MRWYRAAAEKALEANDLAAAIERAGRGVTPGACREDLGALRLVQAEAHLWRGDLALAEERGMEASPPLLGGVGGVVPCTCTRPPSPPGKLGRFDRVEGWVAASAGSRRRRRAAGTKSTGSERRVFELILGGRYGAAERRSPETSEPAAPTRQR